MASFADGVSRPLRRGLTGVVAAALLAACASGRGPAVSGPVVPAAGLPAADTLLRQPEHVVLIAIPGLVAADFLPAPGVRATAPQLAVLAEAGLAVEALLPVFPPLSLPALVSLVTGRGPVRHGVWQSQSIGERGLGAPGPVPASAVQGGTLWQAVAAAGGAVASFDWPATAGTAIAQPLPAAVTDPAAAAPGPARDTAIAAAACTLLIGPDPPRLLLLRLSQADIARASAAPGSVAAQRSIAGADAQVARLVGCLRQAARLESTAIVVTGDHGALPVHTAILPNARLADVGLVTLERGRRVVSWRALARSNGGTAFVYARDAEDALLARRALDESARRSGAFRVVSAQELLARGADPEAWFGLDAAPGWVFDDGFDTSLFAPATRRAAGGYAPGEQRMATGLVAFGAGLRSGLRVPEMRQIDVAPTLAGLLGVGLPDADGLALVGVLRSRGSSE
ncbi:alkaline phosphatase family protein [Myxococcota bacterium]|nr:alkaline phosphatase family protein [Myxococcota bacterium]MCZ7620451.1 alkaline phosphatase family protein [Myxococcota bacterium]